MSSRQHPIPDLWRLNEDAARIYRSYLARLMMYEMYERIVSACRIIRRHAAKDPECRDALFTFYHEIDAQFELQNYSAVLRQLRLREEVIFGERFDLLRRQWSSKDAHTLEYEYAPVHYYLGRYSVGCFLLEATLKGRFAMDTEDSFHSLLRVYDGRDQPVGRHNVTLAQFYSRLNRKLSDWSDWGAFVNGFHPRIFRMAGVERSDLLSSCDKLPEFFERLSDIAKRKGMTSLGAGQSQLFDGPAKIKQRRQKRQEKQKAWRKRTEPQRTLLETKLKELFPELRDLIE